MSWGYRGLNLAIGRWLTRRRAAGDDIWAMVHEACYVFYLRDKPTRWLIAAASALNARALIGASRRVFYTIPAWEPLLRRYDPHPDRPMTWLPVPTTVPPVHDPASVADLRKRIAPGSRTVIGHFGTYGLHADMLKKILVQLLGGRTDRVGLLIGRGGRKFAAEIPDLAGRLIATDGLPPEQVSLHLQACDLMIQPYIDGVSTRRTTVMAALAHGLPVVTALGFLSEPFWSDSAPSRWRPPMIPPPWPRPPNRSCPTRRRGPGWPRRAGASTPPDSPSSTPSRCCETPTRLRARCNLEPLRPGQRPPA